SITVADTPSPAPAAAAPAEAAPESQRAPAIAGLDMGEPMPRLAFVSEPEIELHVRQPGARPIARPPSERPPPPSERPAVPIPSEVPPSAPPPVRLMAQTADAPLAPPVEVWASTHAPRALRGQVASFVGQNA